MQSLKLVRTSLVYIFRLPKRRSGSRPEQSEMEDKVVDRSTIFANQLVAQMMLAMNRNEFNLVFILLLLFFDVSVIVYPLSTMTL